jgi:excisionase family DNA binding protein
MPKNDTRPLLKPDEVAERLGVPKATVYAWSARRNSGLVFMKVGRHLRVHPADLDAYIAAQRVA